MCVVCVFLSVWKKIVSASLQMHFRCSMVRQLIIETQWFVKIKVAKKIYWFYFMEMVMKYAYAHGRKRDKYFFVRFTL